MLDKAFMILLSRLGEPMTSETEFPHRFSRCTAETSGHGSMAFQWLFRGVHHSYHHLCGWPEGFEGSPAAAESRSSGGRLAILRFVESVVLGESSLRVAKNAGGSWIADPGEFVSEGGRRLRDPGRVAIRGFK
jgi:hypothetical protein